MNHLGRFVHVARNRPKRVVVAIDPASGPDETVKVLVRRQRVVCVFERSLGGTFPKPGEVEQEFREAARLHK